MEDYSEDFYKSLNWIEIYEDYEIMKFDEI